MTEPEDSQGIEELPDAETDRACRADEVFTEACNEHGLNVGSFEDFVAWNKFVGGEINETELVEQAKEEIDEYSSTFGKYLVIRKDDDHEEAKKRERARQANRIYRQVCDEAHIAVCFFRNFSAWSDYVEGKIGDSEFREKAKLEIEKMASGVQAGQ